MKAVAHVSWQTPVACGVPSSLFHLQQLWPCLQSAVIEHVTGAPWAVVAEGSAWEDATATPIATSNDVGHNILPRASQALWRQPLLASPSEKR